MSLTGKGKRYGKTKDIRPAPTATHPIEEVTNTSDKIAVDQLTEDTKLKDRLRGARPGKKGTFSPTDNAKYE